MGIFNHDEQNDLPDKDTPAYAVRQFGTARTNLLIAIAFTAVNMILGLIGSEVYFLFSITLPYALCDPEVGGVAIAVAVVVLAFYVCCYLFSKKKPGWMIAALVAFCVDCLLLVVFALLGIAASKGEISLVDILIDVLAHVWVLVYLIIGVRYCRRYRDAVETGDADAQIVTDMSAEDAEEGKIE